MRSVEEWRSMFPEPDDNVESLLRQYEQFIEMREHGTTPCEQRTGREWVPKIDKKLRQALAEQLARS